MKFTLGKKQHMTQYFSEDGKVVPVTKVLVGQLTVTQVKNTETDGYNAIQVGFGVQKKERQSKAVLGHTKNASYEVLREFRTEDVHAVGDIIEPSIFEKGDIIVVSGISKGKGFQGVVKRHNFEGGRRTHGQKHSEREPGSIGGGLRTRVPKGMRMAGRMGNDRVSVKNLEIVHIDPSQNIILIKGAVPGRRGTLLEIVA